MCLVSLGFATSTFKCCAVMVQFLFQYRPRSPAVVPLVGSRRSSNILEDTPRKSLFTLTSRTKNVVYLCTLFSKFKWIAYLSLAKTSPRRSAYDRWRLCSRHIIPSSLLTSEASMRFDTPCMYNARSDVIRGHCLQLLWES